MATRLLHDEPRSSEEDRRDGDEARIRELGNQWARAVTRKDPEMLTALLSERSVMLPPNADSVKGLDEVTRAWEKLLGLPGFTATFEPHRTNVYPTGDVAHDISRYRLSWEGPDGRVQDHGNHLIVWERGRGNGNGDDGGWKVRSNVFYSKSLNRPCPLSVREPGEEETSATA